MKRRKFKNTEDLSIGLYTHRKSEYIAMSKIHAVFGGRSARLFCLLAILSLFISTVSIAHGIEYNKSSEPLFTLDNKTIIRTVDFCFEHEGNTLCRPIGDFKDPEFGISCDYDIFFRNTDVIRYRFKHEFTKPPESVCPLVVNLGNWPRKMITDHSEENISERSIDTSPFAISGNDRSLFFVLNKNYNYTIIKKENTCILHICTDESKRVVQGAIEMVAVPTELNKSNFREHPSISLYENPPTVTLGPEETFKAEIKVKEFFRGSIFEWHPELPYANLALQIYPENKSYNKNETLFIEFRSPSGIEHEELPYNIENKKWNFPKSGTKQIKFDYNSWYFPLSEYETIILIKNNNMSIVVDDSLEIPNSEFLTGQAINSTRDNIEVIEIKIVQNLLTYLVLVPILFIFYLSLGYSVQKVRTETKIPNVIWLSQSIPFGLIFIKDLIPLKSILFLILFLSIVIFLIYYYYKRVTSDNNG